MLERYAALRRGPRLDDRLVMAEPNPANTERLFRRFRIDPRLSLAQAAVSNKASAAQWFAFSGVPNTLGNGGRLLDAPPEDAPQNASAAAAEPEDKRRGYMARVETLDSLLDGYAHVDFLFMDPEGMEPRIFMGAPRTLARVRFMVFGCAEKWKDHFRFTTTKVTLRRLHEAGLTVVMLGKDRNVIMNEPAGPERIYDRMTTWGFCAAIRTAAPRSAAGGAGLPGAATGPAVSNLTALGLLVSGQEALVGTNASGGAWPVCARFVGGAAWLECRGDKAKAKGAPRGAAEEAPGAAALAAEKAEAEADAAAEVEAEEAEAAAKAEARKPKPAAAAAGGAAAGA